MVKKNASIFISGKGSNLKNLIDRSRDYNFPISIKLVVSDKKKALGIYHAKKNSIPILLINTKSRNYENTILNALKRYNIHIICLSGYMKILSSNFLKKFGKKIINIHPSLLPKFKGLNTFSRVLKNKERKTGCTVHFVTKNLDSGKIITQKSFFVNSRDNALTLKFKTQKLEYLAFPQAIIKIFRNY